MGSDPQRFLPEQGNKLPGCLAYLPFLYKTDNLCFREIRGGNQEDSAGHHEAILTQDTAGASGGLGAVVTLIPGEAAKVNFPSVWLGNIWT